MKKLRLSKDTTVCISIAAKPSNFGTTLFNVAFEYSDLDYTYKAFALKPEKGNLKRAIEGMRVLGIRGCGVSMPFKQEALKHVDDADPSAVTIGAINTIVNTNGTLKGYNTDVFGALAVLRTVKGIRSKRVVLLGAGGVARAICAALTKLKVKNATIVTRDQAAGKKLAKVWGFTYVPWKDIPEIEGDVLINATSVGMPPQSNKSPISPEVLASYRAVLDVVISPSPTALVGQAQAYNLQTIPGHVMSLHQAAKQFQLYTGKKPPLDIMQKTLETMY